MWEYNHTDELYHFGVKGMKWGVRKDRNEGSSSSGRRTRQDRDYDKLAKALKKNAKDYGNFTRSKTVLSEFTDTDGNVHQVFTANPRLAAKAQRSEAKAMKLVSKLEKRYGTISMTAGQTKAGKEYVDLILGTRSGRVEED